MPEPDGRFGLLRIISEHVAAVEDSEILEHQHLIINPPVGCTDLNQELVTPCFECPVSAAVDLLDAPNISFDKQTTSTPWLRRSLLVCFAAVVSSRSHDFNLFFHDRPYLLFLFLVFLNNVHILIWVNY